MPSEGVDEVNLDPWARKLVLALEGGGTRGYASLLILQKLMQEVAVLEGATRPPKCFKDPNWKSHHSSFGPPPYPDDVLQNGVPVLPKTPSYIRTPTDERKFRRTEIVMAERRNKTFLELQTRENKFLPCHYFDYIGGTSTGGLAALMLGRLRMSADECVERYPAMAKHIFGRPRKLHLGRAFRDKYDFRYLEEEIKAIVSEHTPPNEDGSGYSKLASPEDLCRTVVVARKKRGNQAHLFRTYGHEDGEGTHPLNPGPAPDCFIWEAGRATSAAPSYFKSALVLGDKYIDVAVGCNDPSWELFSEVETKECSLNYNSAVVPIQLLLTLGTGLKPTVKKKVKGFLARNHFTNRLGIVETTADAATSSNNTERWMQQLTRRYKGELSYYKWDGGLKIGALDLDEYKPHAFENMRSWVREYLENPRIQEEMKRVARILVIKRRERFNRSHDQWFRFTFCTQVQCPFRACRSEPFRTKSQVKDHIAKEHPGSLTDINGELEKEKLLKSPWRRGPCFAKPFWVVVTGKLEQDPCYFESSNQSCQDILISPVPTIVNPPFDNIARPGLGTFPSSLHGNETSRKITAAALMSDTRRRGAWLSVLLLALTRFSFAYNFSRVADGSSWFDSGRTDFSSHTVFGIPGEEFSDATAHPNATGTFPVTGPVLGGDGGGNSSFELKIDVTADISLSNGQYVSFNDAGKTTAVSVLSFGGKSLGEADTSGWTICALVFAGVEWNRMLAAQEDDGSCSLAFGNDQCATDLGKAIMKLYRSRNSCNTDAPPIPSSCRDALFERGGDVGFALWGNKFSLRQLKKDARFLIYGSPPARKGQDGRFEEAVANIWPTVLIFRHEGSDSSGNADFHIMRCLRARNVTETRTVLPSSTPSGSATTSSQRSMAGMMENSKALGWIWKTAGLCVIVLFYL